MRPANARAPLHIVWFKRDLRVRDHQPLADAAARGPVLPLYIVEPDLWLEPDASERQWLFARESLVELAERLAELGQPLVVRVGGARDVFTALAREHSIAHVWSHEETGNAFTYRRDIAVAATLKALGIGWTELPQFGVVRRLKSREGWARRWEARMNAAMAPTVEALTPVLHVDHLGLPSARDLALAPDGADARQRGGSTEATALLGSFLTARGKPYRWAMSTPLEGSDACSRLSPHLALGTISLREVHQAQRRRSEQLRGDASQDAKDWRGSLISFGGRLHWHCHFMQKLEDEPDIEFREFHPSARMLRTLGAFPERLSAWANGETGFPFLDACMRSLSATGWLNFRMRAMVQSFASYNLWLHWRDSGLHLARQFTDYEPGIHWSQAQMQSGTTGINTIRIYNVVKQGYDQDPTGQFVRRWVPELAPVPDAFIHEPWRWSEAQGFLGRQYPAPIVDLAVSTAAAKEQIYAMRRETGFAHDADAVQAKHGSRKAGLPMTGQKRAPRKRSPSSARQLKLDL